MEWVTNLLEFLLPAITAVISSAATWIVSRNLRRTRRAKEIHDTYKSMYEDISKTLKEIQNENEHLRKAILRLEKAVSRAINCKYYRECPIRDELQNGCTGGAKERKKRGQGGQREPDPGADHESGSGAGVAGDVDAED
jgi:hypothetical protein